MKVLAKIIASNRVDYDGKKFVKLQGFLNGLGLFQQSVKEELVPDFLEGKECLIEFSIGIMNFKPYLKVVGISLDTSSVD